MGECEIIIIRVARNNYASNLNAKNLSTTYIDYNFGQVHTLPSKGASQSKLERCTSCLLKTVYIEGPA